MLPRGVIPRDAEGNEIRGQRGAAPAGGAFPGIIGVIFGRSAGTALIEECYEPGRPPADFRPYNAAKLIPAGTDIAINVHYTPNGNPVTDHVRVGFTIAKEPPTSTPTSATASPTSTSSSSSA